MTSEERIVVDTLSNMSRALSRIALELSNIRGMMEKDSRRVASESRKRKAGERMLTESGRGNGRQSEPKRDRLSEKDPLGNIRAVRQGEYLD